MGRLIIIGSGELAPGMVRVHRAALSPHDSPSLAVIDSPYGFQENADELTAKLVDFFNTSLTVDPTIVELRQAGDAVESARARQIIDGSDVVFSGPGSPTYALRVWTESGLASTLAHAIASRTVVFASAAACTLGRWAIPVYEIYKVGADPSWHDGLDAFRLGGLPTLVVPHFDNREGGTHDTSHCYIGARRFNEMRAALPAHVVVGVDEHTAAAFDFGAGTVAVTGRGALHLIAGDEHTRLELGVHDVPTIEATVLATTPPGQTAESDDDEIRGLLSQIVAATGPGAGENAAVALADLAADGAVTADAVRPFVRILLDLRLDLRSGGQYELADRIRSELHDAGVVVNDTAHGTEWTLDDHRIDRPSS